MSTAQLELIEDQLDEIEDSREAHDYAGGVVDMVRALPQQLRDYETRTEYFEGINCELNTAGRTDRSLISKTERLSRQATEAEYLLNAIDDDDIPLEARRPAIHFKAHENLGSLMIRDAYVRRAIDDSDFEVRRAAWLELCHYYASNPRPANSGSGAPGQPSSEDLKTIRKQLIRARGAGSSRGSAIQAADTRDGYEAMVQNLLRTLARGDGERNETALTLSEIGGSEVASLLADALQSEIEEGSEDEDYQVYLASALSNLGGLDALEGLLRAAETGTERVRLAALSGLESLTTAGSIALTEYAEPVTIESESMRNAYVEMDKRLSALSSNSATPSYVRHQASELLRTIQLSLEEKGQQDVSCR